MSTVQHLNWQLGTTKHILKKYKDLSVAQQLHLNAQTVKLATVRASRDKLLSKINELQDRVSQYQNKMVLNKNIEQ